MTEAERIQKAVELVVRFGGFEGSHHKQWVIDQVVRILLEERYEPWLAEMNSDPEEYDRWDHGIAP